MAMPVTAPAPAQGPTVALSVLGTMSVTVLGRSIRIKNRKSSAVLAYIVLNEAFRETRERLVGLFWSESDEEKARGSLRQSLRELRTLFTEAGYQGLRTDKLAVELERASIGVDLWAVIRDAEAHRVHTLLLDHPRLTDTLLEGLDYLDPSFRVWLLAKRETVKGRLLRALEAGLHNEGVDAETRGRLAEAIINLDPTHEEACRHLMRVKAEAGDVSAALRVYKNLWNLLDAEYDMEPSVATQQLVADVKTAKFENSAAARELSRTGTPQAVPAASGQPTPARASAPRAAKIELALEAFDLQGVNPDKVHLVVGFRQHLIQSLVRFREWYVTDGSFQKSEGAAPLPVSARYAVEAGIYQTGDTVHLALTLKQFDTNHYVWSDRFELKLDGWFEAQQNIVRRLTTALNVNLSTERLMRLAGQPDVSLDIYDKWLRGQAAFLSFDPATRREAAETMAEIIREAPGFSPAYSTLAQMINTEHIASPGLFRSRDKERQTLELARNAVRLDPLDSRAHLCMAWSHAMSKQYDLAVDHADLAAQLNDYDPWTMISSAHIHAYCANLGRARELSKLAFEMAPTQGGIRRAYLAKNRFLWGDYEGCIAAASHTNDVLIALSAWTASAYFHAKLPEQATEEARRFLGLIRSRWFGEEPATDENIMRWFLHQYPIASREHWERLRDGLKGTGLPAGGMDHHGW